MIGVNHVVLIGHLGKVPDIKYLPTGLTIANFSLATSEKRKKPDGSYEDKTEWHKIVCLGRLAEICGEYLTKGSLVYIEGKIQSRYWEDKEGNKKGTTEIFASRLQMLDKKREGSKDDSSGGGAPVDEEVPF
jgi:single-strand DNA-binding protein